MKKTSIYTGLIAIIHILSIAPSAAVSVSPDMSTVPHPDTVYPRELSFVNPHGLYVPGPAGCSIRVGYNYINDRGTKLVDNYMTILNPCPYPVSNQPTLQEWTNLIKGFEGYPVKYIGTGNQQILIPGCIWGVSYSTGRSGWGTPTQSCTNVPTPIQCTATSPLEIDHGKTPTGTIRSEATVLLNVTCSGTTTISVRTASPEIVLRADDHSITSSLYVQRIGQTNSVVVAQPTAVVEIKNLINTTTEFPGAYTGSSTVIVSWE